MNLIKKTVGILAIAAVLMGLALYVFHIAAAGIHDNNTKTISQITQIVNDSKVWSEQNSNRSGLLIFNDADPISLNSKIAELFKSCKDPDIHSGDLVSRDGLFRDAWGNPLIFLSTNSSLYKLVNPELQGKSLPFVVWSSGRNKTNELGFGDDLFSHL